MERAILSWSEASHCNPAIIGLDRSVSSILELGKLPSEKLTSTFASKPFVGRVFHMNSTNQYSVWPRGGAAILIDFDRSVSHVQRITKASNRFWFLGCCVLWSACRLSTKPNYPPSSSNSPLALCGCSSLPGLKRIVLPEGIATS